MSLNVESDSGFPVILLSNSCVSSTSHKHTQIKRRKSGAVTARRKNQKQKHKNAKIPHSFALLLHFQQIIQIFWHYSIFIFDEEFLLLVLSIGLFVSSFDLNVMLSRCRRLRRHRHRILLLQYTHIYVYGVICTHLEAPICVHRQCDVCRVVQLSSFWRTCQTADILRSRSWKFLALELNRKRCESFDTNMVLAHVLCALHARSNIYTCVLFMIYFHHPPPKICKSFCFSDVEWMDSSELTCSEANADEKKRESETKMESNEISWYRHRKTKFLFYRRMFY